MVTLSVCIFAGITFSQEKISKEPCFRVTSFSSSLGFGGAVTSNTNSDYYLLKDAVENPELFVDIKGFNNSGSTWYYDGMYFDGFNGGSGNGNVLFNLGLTPYSKKHGKYNENRELRVSVGGSFGTRNSFYYYDNEFFTIDTFQSVTGGGLIYADSSISRNYNYTLDYSEVNFGLSYLFKTDVSRRVHFYAGVGMNYGIALRSTVNIDENIYRSIYYYDEANKPSGDGHGYYGNYSSNANSYSSSSTNLKSPMQFARVFIPVGFNLNLSKKPASFFSHVDLYTELSPGVEFQFLSADKTYANPYVGFAFIGFRYHW